MALVMTGSLRFQFGAEEKIVASGQAMSISSNEGHSVVALEDTLAYDIFLPIRHDWLVGDAAYLCQ